MSQKSEKQKNRLTIAIAGNPNSGKTTMFNALTGAKQHVGNYPGVTVEKREGEVFHEGEWINIVDLPGTYSLTAYSQEELVARKYLVNERPDAVIDIINASTLERNLYLAIQFLELGIPVVFAFNMMDEVRKSGKTIDTQKLSSLFGVPIVETVARTGEGKTEMIETARKHAISKQGEWKPLVLSYGPDLDPLLDEVTRIIELNEIHTNRFPARWIALKYIENDEHILSLVNEKGELARELGDLVQKTEKHLDSTLNMYPEAIIADYRYGYINSIVKQGVVEKTDRQERIAFSDTLDRVLTQRILGPVIMVAVFYAMFYLTFAIGAVPMEWLGAAFNAMGDLVKSLMSEGPIRSLIVSGIIDGVGGVLGFVPLILIMFMMISFLEDSGYMARMAYMLDRVMRIFGLHGCSVMPFIVSGGIPGGCAVPGVMAARTLRSPKEKLATLLTAPFMACGAKVPVFILLAGAFFQESAATALFWITIGAWVAALVVARFLRSTIIRGASTPFVMELPPYRMPTLPGILIHTWERVWQYIKKAGTIILCISVIIWAAMTYPSLPQDRAERYTDKIDQIQKRIDDTPKPSKELTVLREQLKNIHTERAGESLKNSFAGRIGCGFESITKYAGFDWRDNIALLGGFAAKEVIISTLGTAYSLGEMEGGATRSLSERFRNSPGWDVAKALSMIVFVMLYAPCFVTIIAIARESSINWAFFSLVFNTVLAFALSVAVYQVGKLFV